MSSIIKSISLDLQTDQIAKRIPNLSRFVRECLLRFDAMHREPECQVERAYPDKLVFGKCIPNKKRLCMKHWPYGPCNMEDWRTFRAMNECNPDRLYANFRSAQLSRDEWKGTKEERIKLWIEERAKLVNARQIEFDDIVIKGNRKPIRKKTRSSFGKRLIRHLRRKES